MDLIFLITHILPFILFFILWFSNYRSKLQWLLRTFFISLFLLLIYITPLRFILNKYILWVIPAVYVVALILSARKVKKLPRISRADWQELVIDVVFMVAIWFGLNYRATLTQPEPGPRVNMAFPLKNGYYSITNKGLTQSILGVVHGTPTEKYALDIIKAASLKDILAKLGKTGLSAYPTFGETLYSPCDGQVDKANDDYPDLIPPAKDKTHSAGNHVVIICDNFKVLMAHLKNKSLQIEEGQIVNIDDPIAVVGNSGNTDGPHLHIQAHRQLNPNNPEEIEPLEIMFDNKVYGAGDTIKG